MPSSTLPPPARQGDPTTTPVVELVVPVHQEEVVLERSIRRLVTHLRTFPWPVRVTIADNASTDATWPIARHLAATLPPVRAVRLEQKGRGLALREVWASSPAPVLAYLDVDLSTDLDALLPLVAPLVSGHSDLAIGTRLGRGANVVRGPKREVVSRSYNLLLRTTMAAGFSDAQCGFKAITGDAAAALLPLVEDDGWFFDTELLLLAERAGMRIHEVPVDWVDDPDSRVDVVATAREDLRGMARLARGFASGRLQVGEWQRRSGPTAPPTLDRDVRMYGQLVGFAVVGVASTLAWLLLYLLLAGPLGAQAANLVALVVTAVANTAVNRRYTFGVRGPADRWRHQAQGLVAFVVGLALTSGSLAFLHAATSPSRAAEVVVLLVASAASTLVRFALFRAWIFPSRPAEPEHDAGPARSLETAA